MSELDDLENELERELEELDDVEPEDMFHFGAAAAAAAADTASTTTLDEDEPPALPVRRPTESPVKTPEKKLEALKFVRRADGKGFVRKGGSSVNKGGLSTKIRVSLKVRAFQQITILLLPATNSNLVVSWQQLSEQTPMKI